MRKKGAYQQYKDIQIKTANQGKLLLMLYQGCIKFLGLAIRCINDKDFEGANNYLQRARKVINELMSSLNMQQGGEIAENLAMLYEYMNHQLIQANIHKDTEKIKFVKKLLLQLLRAWQEIINGSNTEKNIDNNLSINI
ncbi:flagellar export chaperone FliS [Halocella sp. SP3-1]|uniref:flagellar export chaperone FliS n=1 Tax=Halocella sp. SP3-1 TaxID=2382161 RepID=UPI000F7561E5|nr:flagellar export chaperone FliS [Halocella sp. SP3-1]AZO95880.1 flagellar export chaperone FliS [Halocella sp. SP3-1]